MTVTDEVSLGGSQAVHYLTPGSPSASAERALSARNREQTCSATFSPSGRFPGRGKHGSRVIQDFSQIPHQTHEKGAAHVTSGGRG